MNKREKSGGIVGFIFIAIVLSKLLGLLRGTAVAMFYGTGYVASAYSMASQLPVNFFDMILGSAVSSAFIPVYNGFAEKESRNRADKFASRFLNAVVVVTAVLSAVGMIFTPQIIELMGGGLPGQAKVLASQLLRIMFPLVIFTGMAFTLVGILQSLGEFKVPAIMSLISNLVCILYLFTLNNKFGIFGLSAALLVGWALQFLILVYPAKKKGFNYRISAGIADSGFKNIAVLALPVLLATWVQPINAMVNMRIASGHMGGSGVAALDYANKLYIIAASAFSMAVTNYIFPKLSRLGAVKDQTGWSDILSKSIRWVILATLPIMLIFIVSGEEIVRIIYQRGQFDETSVKMTTSAMTMYSFGMIWFALQEIQNKAFYSVMDTKTPTIAAVGGILTNLGLGIMLSKKMGIAGLALAASVSSFVWCIFSFVKLRKKIDFKNIVKPAKIIVMAVAMALALYSSRQYAVGFIGTESFLARLGLCAASSAIGVAVYLIAAFLLKIEETENIKEFLSRRKKG